MKRAIPSRAQAQFLAGTWAGPRDMIVYVMTRGRDGAEPYVTPTIAACVKRGWLKPTGATKAENGFEYAQHMLSDNGLDALEDFFREARYRRAAHTSGERP